MLTDYNPFESVPRDWLDGFRRIYPGNAHMITLQAVAERRRAAFFDRVLDDGRVEPPPPAPSALTHAGGYGVSREDRRRLLPTMYREGLSQAELARYFGVSQALIWRELRSMHEPTRAKGPQVGYEQTAEHIAHAQRRRANG